MKVPAVYDVFSHGVARADLYSWLSASVIDAKQGQSILDVGCGTSKILRYLPEARYVGIDHNPEYIEASKRTYGSKGEFILGDVNDDHIRNRGQFDRILLLGVLHHLSDDEVIRLVSQLARTLKKDGHLVTFDNALVEGQHPLARLLAKLDRGRYVRSPNEYRMLLETALDVETEIIRHDLLRVPYTHVIFRAAAISGSDDNPNSSLTA